MMRWLASVGLFVLTSPVLANSLVLGTVELAAVRQCVVVNPAWGAALSAQAREHLVDGRFHAVIVHDDDSWVTASVSMRLSPVTSGDEGDFASVTRAIEDPWFKAVHCVLLKSVAPHTTGHDPCSIEVALGFAYEQPAANDMGGLREWIGGHIDDLYQDPVAELGAQYGELALRAKADYVQGEYERQVAALANAMSADLKVSDAASFLGTERLRKIQSFTMQEHATGLISLKAGDARLYLVGVESDPGALPPAETTLTLSDWGGTFRLLKGSVGTKELAAVRLTDEWREVIAASVGEPISEMR